MMTEALKHVIRDIPDFPKKGIIFKDITPLLQDAAAFKTAIDALAEPYIGKPVDIVLGIEARGFLFASALAYTLGTGVAIVRKPGKLPYKTRQITYDLEYGTDRLEIHEDALKSGQNVLIVDDVLATGGTVKGVTELVKNLGANIFGVAFLVELSFLNGRDKLKNYHLTSVMTF